MRNEFDYIIVGAGLCGLSLAKELSRKDKRVLVVERGSYLKKVGSVVRAAAFYDSCALSKTKQGNIIYRAFGVGGTSVVSCFNAVDPTDEILKAIGIDIREQLEETKKECHIGIGNVTIGRASRRIMEAATKLGYDMHPMPKFGFVENCISCGNCVLGCPHGAKWTALEFLKDINKMNVTMVTDFNVKKLISVNGEAVGIEGKKGKLAHKKFYGDKIIVSAGGLGSPVILQNSGLKAGSNLFVDWFTMVCGIGNIDQHKEVTMPLICDTFHQKDGFILSPLIDNWIGFSSTVGYRNLLRVFQLHKMMGIMVKIKDEGIGSIDRNGKIDKTLTSGDMDKLSKGENIAKEILIECGVVPRSLIVTKPRGAHPGGTAGIGRVINNRFQTEIKNLFVCDASILPQAPGFPPMATLIALSKWFAKNVEG